MYGQHLRQNEWSAAYLGGHPRFPVQREPTTGALRITPSALQFLVHGEYLEVLFEVPWPDVTSWDVEGANTATRQTSGGRAAIGALIAGVPGAIVGLAASKEGFSSVLALSAKGGSTVGFLIRDLPPTAVIAALRAVDGVAHLYRCVEAEPALRRWEHTTATLTELEMLGEDGWEAVGVWMESSGAPRVLLKRPRLD